MCSLFESGIRRNILEGMREEVTRDWRNLHKEKLHDCIPPNTIAMIK
jgi:hypothetical protein